MHEYVLAEGVLSADFVYFTRKPRRVVGRSRWNKWLWAHISIPQRNTLRTPKMALGVKANSRQQHNITLLKLLYLRIHFDLS